MRPREVPYVDVGIPGARENFDWFDAGEGVVKLDHGLVEGREGVDFVDRGLPCCLASVAKERRGRVDVRPTRKAD